MCLPQLRWVKGVCLYRCNLPPALLAEWLVFFLRATVVARGWNGHRIRISTQSWLWRRKFSRRSCLDSNFRSRVRHFYQQAILVTCTQYKTFWLYSAPQKTYNMQASTLWNVTRCIVLQCNFTLPKRENNNSQHLSSIPLLPMGSQSRRQPEQRCQIKTRKN